MKSLGIITCDDTYHYWGDIMISYEQEWQLHQSHKIPAFEGWYFRVVDNQVSAAVIIGIAKTQDKWEVFYTLCQSMEKVSYDIKDFVYQEEPFAISIKDSIFKKHYIHIEDSKLSTVIDLELDMPLHIQTTKYAPTIMGPFAYLKNMQCNHAIINLESQTHDYLKYQNQIYDIQGFIYQEKDWSNPFPKRYMVTIKLLFTKRSNSISVMCNNSIEAFPIYRNYYGFGY